MAPGDIFDERHTNQLMPARVGARAVTSVFLRVSHGSQLSV